MAANPADIARYTTNGTLITAPANPLVSAAIKGDHIDARDGGANEMETFWVDPDDAQVMAEALFSYQSQVDPLYLAVEVSETLGLGSTIPIAPRVPCARITDLAAGLDTTARVRSYAQDMGTDRFSIEVIE
jgi:hypothetical protein